MVIMIITIIVKDPPSRAPSLCFALITQGGHLQQLTIALHSGQHISLGILETTKFSSQESAAGMVQNLETTINEHTKELMISFGEENLNLKIGS